MNQKMSTIFQAHSDYALNRLAECLSMDFDISDYPTVKVFDHYLKGEDRGCDGIYDPETNEIHLVFDMTKDYYTEYDNICNSPLIGDVSKATHLERLEYLLLHELAHWMTDFVLKNYSHKHGRSFKVCYALLRSLFDPKG